MKNISLITLAVLMGATVSAQAVPARCPSVESIKAFKLYAEKEERFYSATTYDSHFDTPLSWIFQVGPFEAQDDVDALQQAEAIIEKLSGTPKPEEVNIGGSIFYVCEYTTDGFHRAAAVHYRGN